MEASLEAGSMSTQTKHKGGGDTIESRLTRIESKLTRSMLANGLDAEGNPSNGMLVVAEDMVEGLLDVLWWALDITEDSDNHDVEFILGRNTAERLYNQLHSMKEGRWPTKS